MNIYTHVCPRVSDDKGNHIKGCGKGWNSNELVEKCSTCGDVSQLRSQYHSTPLRPTKEDQ